MNSSDGNASHIDLTHGGGGRATAELVRDLFLKHFSDPELHRADDAARLDLPPGRVVTSTDGHVISPLFFPGGDIGALAVNGTVNDVAMMGAQVHALTAGFIIEEGFPQSDLDRIVQSMAEAARNAGVAVVAGDTKVVEKGNADGLFITTTGIGTLPGEVDISARNAQPGQAIVCSGSIGDHGVAVLSKRENLEFGTELRSDCAALNGLVADMLTADRRISVLRDPTRGGLAAALNEIAQSAKVGIEIDEAAIPVKPDVKAACELLGLDPLHVANEGKLICFCHPDAADTLVSAMRMHPLGREAAIIGKVVSDENRLVRMVTSFGGVRVVDWLSGEQLPRIC